MNQLEKNQKIKKGDFVEIKFTGFVDGKIFDSNIEEDLKQINNQATPSKTILIIGQRMVVKGLDDYLEGKELNKDYEIKIDPKDAFGSRKTELVRIIPLKVFHSQKINPQPGTSFVFDNQLAKVITVSGARVITDFNNPLAGKEIVYKFNVKRLVEDIKEKTETICKLLFRYIPQVSIDGENVKIKGPKILESFIVQSQAQFKEFLGREVLFEETEISPQESKQE